MLFFHAISKQKLFCSTSFIVENNRSNTKKNTGNRLPVVEKPDMTSEILHKLNPMDPIRDLENSFIVFILLSMLLQKSTLILHTLLPNKVWD